VDVDDVVATVVLVVVTGWMIPVTAASQLKSIGSMTANGTHAPALVSAPLNFVSLAASHGPNGFLGSPARHVNSPPAPFPIAFALDEWHLSAVSVIAACSGLKQFARIAALIWAPVPGQLTVPDLSIVAAVLASTPATQGMGSVAGGLA